MTRCVRDRVDGERCTLAAVTGSPFEFLGWLTALGSCKRHLTPDERTRWDEEMSRATAAAQRSEPGCWSWPVPADLAELVSPEDAAWSTAYAARIGVSWAPSPRTITSSGGRLLGAPDAEAAIGWSKTTTTSPA